MHLIKLVSRNMLKSKNQPKPNIKTISNLYNGLKDIMISTVGKEAITTWPNKGEAMPPLTSLLPRKLLYPRLIMLREWPRKLVTMQ